MYKGFETNRLDDAHSIFVGRLPDSLIPSADAFESLWSMHPEAYHVIKIHGRPVKTPRWQQAYGRDYHYTGRTNAALPMTEGLSPFLAWAQEGIDPRLNGLLLNWYDADLKHYIGAHRDSRTNMIEGSPIVTISLGADRIFRLRSWRRKGDPVDLPAVNGAVFLTPFATNLAWTHEVPHRSRDRGRRISVTIRAFED